VRLDYSGKRMRWRYRKIWETCRAYSGSRSWKRDWENRKK